VETCKPKHGPLDLERGSIDQSPACSTHLANKRPPGLFSFFAEHLVDIRPLKIPHNIGLSIWTEHLRRRRRKPPADAPCPQISLTPHRSSPIHGSLPHPTHLEVQDLRDDLPDDQTMPWRANPSHGGHGSWHAAPNPTSLFCSYSSIDFLLDSPLVFLELHMCIRLNWILSYFVDRNMCVVFGSC
jgi:hypothetical protein